MAFVGRLSTTIIGICFAFGLTACSPRLSDRSNAEQLPRGKYLVENVGMCGDCHSPRNARGELDHTRWLQGTQLDFQSPHPPPNFTNESPALAGLPRIGDAAVIKLLETGLKPDGKSTRPPMPQLRLSHDDAVAVAEYLKSLPTGGK